MTGIYRLIAFAVLLAASSAGSASAAIEVEALFTNAAALRIDGERKMLKAGQSYRGVTLVAAHSGTATLEVQCDGNVEQLDPNGYAITMHSFKSPGDYIVRVQRTNLNGVRGIGHLHVRVE